MKIAGGRDFKVDPHNPNEEHKKWSEFLFKFWYSQGCRPEYTQEENFEIAVKNLKKSLCEENKNGIKKDKTIRD